VVLLGAHMAFGLRVLAIEFLPWPGHLKRAAGLGAGAALLIGVLFLVNVG
jgi:fumarate reductase subunit D